MGAGSTFTQGANPNAANPYAGSTNPYIQSAQATTLGNLAGATQATAANRVNQVTPYGNLNYSKTTDQYGNPTWTATQSLSPELQDLTQSSLKGLQASQENPMYGINPGETYSDAIMRRLAPQIAQSDEQQTAALANQGIVPGTIAYDNAMRTYNQGKNDLLTSAQINGMNTGLQAQQLQGTQATNIKSLSTPNYVNPYSQAAVSGPDYLGAYSTSNAQAIAAQNAANAKTANTQSGLYGLGGAALLGSGGIGGLANLASSGISGLSGLSQYFNNLGGDPTAGGTISPDTGLAAQTAANYYGSTYNPLAGWSM